MKLYQVCVFFNRLAPHCSGCNKTNVRMNRYRVFSVAYEHIFAHFFRMCYVVPQKPLAKG